MSGPSWLPPRTLGSPERPVPQMSHSGAAIYALPNKKASSDPRPKHAVYDQNGGGGRGGATRYMATGPTGGPVTHPSNDRYYHERTWSPHHERPWSPNPNPNPNPHMDSYELMRGGAEKPGGHHSNIDAEIDSLTSMLAELDSNPQNCSTQLYDNVPCITALPADCYKSSAQTRAPSLGRPSMGYPPHPQSQHHPAPAYPTAHQLAQYTTPHQQDYSYTSTPKPYPQPVPASYTTASTSTGPRFSVQVKTAQPVTYSQTGRQAEQAYTPPPPRQQAARPPPQAVPQGWHPAHLAPQAQDGRSEAGYKGGSGTGSGGRAHATPKRGLEMQPGASPAHQPGKGSAARPEEELDRLTKKLVYDMNHPPAEEYFGRCARCGDNVLGDGSGCIAMEQVFHVECFTCITCHARLRGQPFYALDKKSYCENCYISTLECCSKCSQPILERILRAMGRAYHPRCFSCVVCARCLDGVPFTVDASSQIHCIEDFHRKFAPRCSVCGQAIMPEPGQEETVRIVALDRSFHVNCYVCEECGLLLSSEGEGRGCYPLDGHILCKSCSARRIQDLSARLSTDC